MKILVFFMSKINIRSGFLKEKTYKKVEYYLYNYKNIDKIIANISEDIIDKVNVGARNWLNGKYADSNTVENQAIKLAMNEEINDLKKAKEFIKQSIEILKVKNPKRYRFIKMKYFDKSTYLDIQRVLNYDEKQQNDITDRVVLFFYKKFKKSNMGGM